MAICTVLFLAGTGTFAGLWIAARGQVSDLEKMVHAMSPHAPPPPPSPLLIASAPAPSPLDAFSPPPPPPPLPPPVDALALLPAADRAALQIAVGLSCDKLVSMTATQISTAMQVVDTAQGGSVFPRTPLHCLLSTTPTYYVFETQVSKMLSPSPLTLQRCTYTGTAWGCSNVDASLATWRGWVAAGEPYTTQLVAANAAPAVPLPVDALLQANAPPMTCRPQFFDTDTWRCLQTSTACGLTFDDTAFSCSCSCIRHVLKTSSGTGTPQPSPAPGSSS
jgi:hypothetical protein